MTEACASNTRKLISIISPTYNEVENIDELYQRVCAVMAGFSQYEFEYVLIDNASTDGTDLKLKEIALRDPRVKVIINTRNFGHIRSPYWGIIQTKGDATVYLASDLQDPPELIPNLIKLWEDGNKIVLATKPVSATNVLIHALRRTYYKVLDAISEVDLVKDTTGFGIYDRVVINKIREINDPYPYLRGLICELGYSIKTIDFSQPARKRGVSKNNFYTLYDIAMLGIVSHSMVPIRVASLLGMALGFLSLLFGFGVLVAKLLWWSSFPVGIAPMYILMFLLFGLLFLFVGMLGEYIGSIHGYLQNRPVIVEKERINF
jgi:glycosyltransferase involved in cell wall biosynthesis